VAIHTGIRKRDQIQELKNGIFMLREFRSISSLNSLQRHYSLTSTFLSARRDKPRNWSTGE